MFSRCQSPVPLYPNFILSTENKIVESKPNQNKNKIPRWSFFAELWLTSPDLCRDERVTRSGSGLSNCSAHTEWAERGPPSNRTGGEGFDWRAAPSSEGPQDFLGSVNRNSTFVKLWRMRCGGEGGRSKGASFFVFWGILFEYESILEKRTDLWFGGKWANIQKKGSLLASK